MQIDGMVYRPIIYRGYRTSEKAGMNRKDISHAKDMISEKANSRTMDYSLQAQVMTTALMA
jgi:hypothetical protein